MDQHDLDAVAEKIAEAHQAEEAIVQVGPHTIHPDEFGNPQGGDAENPFSLEGETATGAPASTTEPAASPDRGGEDERAIEQDAATNQGAGDLEDRIFQVGHESSDTD